LGYSFDGYNSLAMSGARVDPEFYLAQCEQADSLQPALSEFRSDYFCSPAENWDEFSEHAGAELTASTDGLWQPMTDVRIKAVMPMGPEGAWLFGERGLAAADRPTLILCGTEDADADYQREAVYIFDHLGAPDKALISFVGEEHMMIESDEPVAKMKHFAAAFFGYYLQGRQEYAGYFSEDFVNRQENLAWGVYTGE
jgi:predicted dienelactone hydrolase